MSAREGPKMAALPVVVEMAGGATVRPAVRGGALMGAIGSVLLDRRVAIGLARGTPEDLASWAKSEQARARDGMEPRLGRGFEGAEFGACACVGAAGRAPELLRAGPEGEEALMWLFVKMSDRGWADSGSGRAVVEGIAARQEEKLGWAMARAREAGLLWIEVGRCKGRIAGVQGLDEEILGRIESRLSIEREREQIEELVGDSGSGGPKHRRGRI